MKKAEVKDVLDLLDKWRGFPSYQMERRADIFFAYYLPMIMMKCIDGFGEEKIITESIIPEFPLKKRNDKTDNESNAENPDTYHSYKVDYAVFCESTLYLVELKTDVASLRDVQSSYLAAERDKDAEKNNFFELISNIPEIGSKSKQGRKYKYLIERIEKILETVYASEPLKCDTWNNKDGYFKAKQQALNSSALVNTIGKKVSVKTVYILPDWPKNDDTRKMLKNQFDAVITFDRIKNELEGVDKRFCESLDLWIPLLPKTSSENRWKQE
jgi:hypothetical protein